MQRFIRLLKSTRGAVGTAAFVTLIVIAAMIRYAAVEHADPRLLFVAFFPTVLVGAWIGGIALGAFTTASSLLLLMLTFPALREEENPLVVVLPLAIEGLGVSFLVDRLLEHTRTTLTQQAENMRIFINEAPAAIALFDREMRYLGVSARWIRDYNLVGQQLVGRCHYEVFPELPERWKQVHQRCLRGAIESAVGEPFVRSDGSTQWISWEVHPWIKDPETNEVGGLLIFSEDITELRKAHDHESALRTSAEVDRALRLEAERLNRAKDEFVATLSHELRTPLNAMLGWITLMKRAQNDPARLTQALAAIERSAGVLRQLIADILDINRITAGKLRLKLEDISVDRLFEGALQTAFPEAEIKGVTLVQEPPNVQLTLHGDTVRLQQCLWNLLSNAIKFTPRGGQVFLSSKRVEDTLQIAVRDTGQGIAAESLPHVFERFVQADSSSTRTHAGLGLGLAIVHHLVGLHGGTITAASPGAGHGSTFTMTLPLAHPGPAAAAVTETVGAIRGATDLKGAAILVLDDELDAREVVRGLLEDCGATVFTAANAAEGLAVATTHNLDLIISDIAMPGTDGYTFLQQVRTAGKRTPALALTAFSGDLHIRRAAAAGFESWLEKPVQASQLVQLVREILTRQRAAEAQ